MTAARFSSWSLIDPSRNFALTSCDRSWCAGEQKCFTEYKSNSCTAGRLSELGGKAEVSLHQWEVFTTAPRTKLQLGHVPGPCASSQWLKVELHAPGLMFGWSFVG